MKILFVVQGYGPEAIGGAESHCRMMATRLAQRGHNVDVLTSCAVSYHDWANHYEPGTSCDEGVRVHRLPVDKTRQEPEFPLASQRVLIGHKPCPLFLQDYWIDAQGPHMPELEPWLDAHAASYDVVSFFTYLYYPTVRGVPIASKHTTTVLHPLAHDEPPLRLPVFRRVFSRPDALIFNIEEEARLVHNVFRPKQPELILGIGTDMMVVGEPARFRTMYELGDAPYLVCVGRVDTNKGSDELRDQFLEYKKRNPSDLKLVFVGPAVTNARRHNDIVMTGYVDEVTKNGAVAGAIASVHPSYFESFSMALVEAWVQHKPTLVNGRCDVFLGQVTRSRGGLAYRGFAEFEAAVNLVIQDKQFAHSLARSGRRYVETHFAWDTVLERYEAFLAKVGRGSA